MCHHLTSSSGRKEKQYMLFSQFTLCLAFKKHQFSPVRNLLGHTNPRCVLKDQEHTHLECDFTGLCGYERLNGTFMQIYYPLEGERLSVLHLFLEVRGQIQLHISTPDSVEIQTLARGAHKHFGPELLLYYPSLPLLCLCLVKHTPAHLAHILLSPSLPYQQLIDQPFWLHGWKSFSLSVVDLYVLWGKRIIRPSHTLSVFLSLSTPLRACL